MSKSETLVDQYSRLDTDIQTLLQTYEEKLNALDTVGVGLIARIISSITMFRKSEELFAGKENPDNYLNALFEEEFNFLDRLNLLTVRLETKGGIEEDRIMSDDDARDELHKDLFNQTWHTLKMSGDPFNDYKPYLKLIEQRLEINGLDQSYFKEKTCLDVGCGTGRFSFCMAEFAQKVYGVDPGEKSINQAKELADTFKLCNVEFSVGNAYHLDFDNETFDFVVCNGVLHHLDEQENALKEIYRVMKPGGQFWLYIEGSGGIYHDIWSIVCRSFNGIPLSRVIKAINELRIPNLHFWMDMFFAKYHLISWDDNEQRLNNIGFAKVERMKGADYLDMDIKQFEDDPFAGEKFGDGGMRMLITK